MKRAFQGYWVVCFCGVVIWTGCGGAPGLDGEDGVEANQSAIIYNPDGPDYEPPPTASIYYSSKTYYSIKVRYKCGLGTNQLYRRPAGGYYQKRADLSCSGSVWNYKTDYSLQQGTQYCYKIKTTGLDGTVRWSSSTCATTYWKRFTFTGTKMTTYWADRMLADFDWNKTDPAGEIEYPNRPRLYYMNVLVSEQGAFNALRSAGIQILDEPLYPAERQYSHETLANQNGTPVGRWYFAVVPGKSYNRIRTEMKSLIAQGKEPPFRAIAYRRIPDYAGRYTSSDMSWLKYQHLVEQGFEYNVPVPQSNCTDYGDVQVCSTQQELLGWLAKKLISWAVDAFKATVEAVREAIGYFTRLIKGEVYLTLQFYLREVDPIFDINTGPTSMRSGWSGNMLRLKKVKVRVRQGLASFSGTTDDYGRVTIKVAKGHEMQVCIETENDKVKLTEFISSKLICVETLPATNYSTYRPINVQHEYFSMLASMTDAADYLKQVGNYSMSKITVLVGTWANRASFDGPAFTPCMGRVPNLMLGGTLDLMTAAWPPALVASAVVEFLYSVDIVMPTPYGKTRAVAVHEFGHAVMCDMLYKTGFSHFQQSWTDVILGSANQTWDKGANVMAEAFADFIAGQVIGANDYFAVIDYIAAPHANYCRANTGAGLDHNFKPANDLPNAQDAFNARVRWAASVMHDAFDGHAAGTQNPNDGCHFQGSSAGITHEANQTTHDLQDEPLQLGGADIYRIFHHFGNRSYDLNEVSFLGGLSDTLKERGYNATQICDMFKLHSNDDSCPSYVTL